MSGERDVLGALESAANSLLVRAAERDKRQIEAIHSLLADAATLRELREALAETRRLVRCEACRGKGGVMHPSGDEVQCEYCHATGEVIVIPSALMDRGEAR